MSLKGIGRPSKWPAFIETKGLETIYYSILFYSIRFKGGRRRLLETGIGGGGGVWIKGGGRGAKWQKRKF